MYHQKILLPKRNVNNDRNVSCVLNILKYMSKNDINNLYDKLGKAPLPKIVNIKFKTVATPKTFGRYIIHIYEIHYDNNTIVPSNIYMYKSSGESRNTGLCDYWLPVSGIEIIRYIKSKSEPLEIETSFRLLKPEDPYILKYSNYINELDTIEVMRIKLYGRFINLDNLKVSKYLYDNNNTINLDENVHEIDYENKMIILFVEN